MRNHEDGRGERSPSRVAGAEKYRNVAQKLTHANILKLIHAEQEPHRIAARPPLLQPASRRSAVTISITHGLNDEYTYLKDARAHLLEDAAWGACSLLL